MAKTLDDIVNNKFYTAKEVADMLGVTSASIRNWIYKGDLEAIKLAGQYKISEQDLEKYIQEKVITK